MKNAIIGMTMAMALAGVSLFAQTAPASSSKVDTTTSTAKTRKAGAKKHAKSTAKLKSTNKTSASTTAK